MQIVDRKREQQRHQYQFQLLLDAMPDAIVVVNDAGVVRYVNQTAIDLLGRRRNDQLDEDLNFSVTNTALDGEIVIFDGTGNVKGAMRDARQPASTGAVESIPTWRRCATSPNASRRRPCMRAVPELEAENRRILEANRPQKRIPWPICRMNCAHLSIPSSASRACFTTGSLTRPRRSTRNSWATSWKQGNTRASPYQRHSRSGQGRGCEKVSYCPERVDLAALINESISILSATYSKSQVHITVDFDASLVDVQVDPSRFKQILYNYISNALKFTPPNGRVTIPGTRAEGVSFRLEVEDTGIRHKPRMTSTNYSRNFIKIETGMAKKLSRKAPAWASP